jgi:hypothetical protein
MKIFCQPVISTPFQDLLKQRRVQLEITIRMDNNKNEDSNFKENFRVRYEAIINSPE